MLFIALSQLSGMKTHSLPPNTLRKNTLSLQLWHHFSPLLLCDGSPGLASLTEICDTAPFLGLTVFCVWGLQTLFLGSVELNQPTGLLMLQNMVLPPNSSYPQMCDMASTLAWVLVLVEPFWEWIQLSITKENILRHFGGWAVKLLFQWLSRFSWLSEVPTKYQSKVKQQKSVAESKVSKRSGEEGMAASY